MSDTKEQDFRLSLEFDKNPENNIENNSIDEEDLFYFKCDSGDLISSKLYCNGDKKISNSQKPPDCLDGSDENLQRCCRGNFNAYDEETCSFY